MQKRFITMFNTQGWMGIYIVGVLIHWFMSVLFTAISYFFLEEPDMSAVINLGISVLQILITSFFYTMAYTKAIILLINKTSLEGKRFSTELVHSQFFFFMFSNILVCVFTLGIYVPWAYKAIINRIAESIKTEDGGSFSFLSKSSALFSVFVISLALIFITAILSTLSFVVAMKFDGILALSFFLIALVFIVAFLASVVAMQVSIINWCINFSYISPNKKVTYTLNVNIVSAIFFYLGQLFLVAITLGFYMGAYMLNVYEYFVNKIEERESGMQTGKMFFIRPIGKGAGFLLLQVILSALTAGIYVPFAYTEYARFFINNTFLYVKDEHVKDEQNTANCIEENIVAPSASTSSC